MILIVDDASTDRTRQIAEYHAGRDPRIRVIRSERRRGPGAARNLALDQSQGQWIAVLDADDRYHVDRLASLLAIARHGKADIVAAHLWLVGPPSGPAFRASVSSGPKDDGARGQLGTSPSTNRRASG